MNEASSKILRFKGCELDLDRRELRRDGELVSLEPRVFALLVYLIDQRHRAVDKDEIQDAVWTGMIVAETALTRAIMKARRAVGDSADTQEIIRTVHGHGYQFVAVPQDEKPSTRTSNGDSTATKPRVLAAAVAITLIGFIVYLWPSDTPAGSVHLAIMPVENLTDDSEYDWTELGLLGFASDLVTQSGELSVMRASDAIRFAEVNGLPDDDSVVDDLEELRDVYGASHVLLTHLEQNAGSLRLTYALHSGDGAVERGTMVGAEPTPLARGMIRSIMALLGSRGRDAEVTVIADDPFINEAYSRGLALSLEGRCGEALQLFDVVRSAADTISRAHYEWASCAQILGRWQDAEAAFIEILTAQPEEPATTLRALAHHGLGTVYIRTGRGDAARETLLLGLQAAQQAGDRYTEGMILNNLAINAKDRREYDEARDLLARSMVAYTEAKRGILPGQLPAALANIDMGEGKFEEADEHLTQALETFRATGDRRNEAMMLNNFGYLRRIQGRVDEAEPMHLESLAIRREIGDRVGQGRILGMLSTLYLNADRYEDAEAAANEAFEIASEANDKLFMATSLAQLASVQFQKDELDSARDTYARSGAIFAEIEDYSRAAQVAVRHAHIDVKDGDLATASQRLDDVLALSLREALHEPSIEAKELRADIAKIQEDVPAAIDYYQQTLQQIEETGFVSRKARVTIKLANLLLDHNDLAAAEPLLGYLIGAGDSANALRVRARYSFLKGDTTRAIELLESIQASLPGDWSEEDTETLSEYRRASVAAD